MNSKGDVKLPEELCEKYDIVEYQKVDETYYLVLRNVGHGMQPWVTHKMAFNEGGVPEFYWGNYHIFEEDARSNYAKRLERYS